MTYVSLERPWSDPTPMSIVYTSLFSRGKRLLLDWYLFTIEAPLINAGLAKWMKSQLTAYRPHATPEHLE